VEGVPVKLNRSMLMDAVVAARLNADLPLLWLALGRKWSRGPKFLVWPCFPAGTLMVGLVPVPAATPSPLDTLAAEVAETVHTASLKPISRPNREGGKPLPSGNPLWPSRFRS
jgi:hypothetical protein